MAELGGWHGTPWHWRSEWRQELNDGEKYQVSELAARVEGFGPSRDALDRWLWVPCPVGVSL